MNTFSTLNKFGNINWVLHIQSTKLKPLPNFQMHEWLCAIK